MEYKSEIMKCMEALSEKTTKDNPIPISVHMDVTGRMQDWINSGGKFEDAYIQNQLRHADRVLNRMKEVAL